MATRYVVQVRTDPSRHVQNPAIVPWIEIARLATKGAADVVARDERSAGNFVRVVVRS